MAGISAFDPDSGLMLRFTEYAEDSAPSWNPAGSRLVFASNREGDRRWRIYLVWAEVNGGVDTLGFGEAPNWHPFADLIVFRGCDQSGNNCGLWTMSSSGGSRAPLTNVPDDNRPTWSPDGSFVVFMSSGRDGNYEIYRVETESGQVTRLTNNAGLDALPVVSPDGAWVAYASNRDGSWKIWAIPSTGGTEHIVAPFPGDINAWQEHGMQWVY
jgi:TolB protein